MPFGDLWYLISLVLFIAWRPFAMEMRHTVLIHALFGCLVGYTSVGNFLSLQRTVVLMPFFLLGHALRRHRLFFAWATSVPARMAAGLIMLGALGGCITAVCAFGYHSSAVWEMSLGYRTVHGARWKWGMWIQMGAYAASFLVSAAFFALVPPASLVHVQEPANRSSGKEDDDKGQGTPGTDPWGECEEVEEELGAAGDPLLVRGRRAGEARERDQIMPGGGGSNTFAVVYLRLAKYGARALCPLVFNVFVMILLEVCTYYDDTWTRYANGVVMGIQTWFSFVLGLAVYAALATRPVCRTLGWILTPPVALFETFVFEDEATIDGIPDGQSVPSSPA